MPKAAASWGGESDDLRALERRFCPSVGWLAPQIDADQRRFAGAVFAEQRVNLAAPDLQIDAVERHACREIA